MERRIALNVQAAVTMAAAGADIEIPEPADVREQFDQWLREPPKQLTPKDRDKETILAAVGLRKV